jgi:hypothetical protein
MMPTRMRRALAPLRSRLKMYESLSFHLRLRKNRHHLPLHRRLIPVELMTLLPRLLKLEG